MMQFGCPPSPIVLGNSSIGGFPVKKIAIFYKVLETSVLL